MSEDPKTEELRQIQSGVESHEEEAARQAAQAEEAARHERRADKARYLKEKLEERAASDKA